jgi:cell division protein FtsB
MRRKDLDRATLLGLISRAERHIVITRERVDSQYRTIAKLEKDGQNTEAAVEQLKQLIETHEDLEQDRDWLLSKLKDTS